MAKREKKPVHKVVMTEGKRQIIQQLLQEYDIETAEDIQEALKDLLGGTIKEMMEAEMDDHLGYEKSERSDSDDYRNGYKEKTVNSSYGSMRIEVPQDRKSTFEPRVVKKRQKDISDIDQKIISMYRSRISGPILERIDIQKWVRKMDYFDLRGEETDYTSAQMRQLVERARRIQEDRYRDEEGIYCNAQMTVAHIQKYCFIDDASTAIIKEQSDKYGYSARVIHKLLRMARTAADVRESADIEKEDIIKVLGCRELDKSNSQMYTV